MSDTSPIRLRPHLDKFYMALSHKLGKSKSGVVNDVLDLIEINISEPEKVVLNLPELKVNKKGGEKIVDP